MQKVLIMTTEGSDLRSKAIGWSAEDGREAVVAANTAYVERGGRGNTLLVSFREFFMNREVGLLGYYGASTSDRFYTYPTPYHALGEGWKLLAPPTIIKEVCIRGGEKVEATYYEWWFEKS